MAAGNRGASDAGHKNIKIMNGFETFSELFIMASEKVSEQFMAYLQSCEQFGERLQLSEAGVNCPTIQLNKQRRD